jgi:hypothetical protein
MEYNELKKIFNNKKQRVDKKTSKIYAGFLKVKYLDFLNWFNIEVFLKGCYYCGTTNETSFKLYEMQRKNLRPDATRGGKRSKRLEIDRKNPILPYDDLSNLVWCCYWCNNAKSNFFTEKEFQPIAKAIGEAIGNIEIKKI